MGGGGLSWTMHLELDLWYCNKNHQWHCSNKSLRHNYEQFLLREKKAILYLCLWQLSQQTWKRGFHNRINLILQQIKFPWINMARPITNDTLRINLKQTFHFIWLFKHLLTYFNFIWNCTSVLEFWVVSGSYSVTL